MVPSIRRRATHNAEPEENKERLVDMPLDVLIEIFLFLEPLDLLHLARTTKGLRAFFLSRNKSSVLWKNAISNVNDLPPCPDHMSAPAYTHLAFVPVCHGCFDPCETVEWELRMRCCPTCFPKMTMPRSFIVRAAHSYLNEVELPTARNHYRLVVDRGLNIEVSLDCISPVLSFSRSDWNTAKSRKRPKGVTREEFLVKQEEFWGSVRKHARSCQDWEYSRLVSKAIKLSMVRRQRVLDIKDNLLQLGWKASDVSCCCGREFLQLPGVAKLEPLTATEWTEIQPQVVSWLKGVKEESIWNYRMDLYDSAFLSIRQMLQGDASLEVRPMKIDIATLPVVRSMLEGSIYSNVNHDDLKKKFFRVLPRAIRKWSLNAVEKLERFAREQMDLPRLSKPACLPSVIFRCRTCRKRFSFNQALSHVHLYKERRIEEKNTSNVSTYEKRVMGYNTHPRNIRVLRVDVIVSRRVENLIRRMGKNPSRVTYNELCRSTVKVVCGLCCSGMSLNFERAFEHCLQTHLGKRETDVWTRVSAREKNVAVSSHTMTSLVQQPGEEFVT